MKYYFSLGSNLEVRRTNLIRALRALEKEGLKLLQVSSLYETQPVDFIEQPWFLNCAVIGESFLPPQEILLIIQQIELKQGRIRDETKGPRLIDIDIILVENQIIKTPWLTVPHPRLEKRNFVLIPLTEIAPDKIHPVFNKSIEQLLNESPDRSLVYPVGSFWPVKPQPVK